MLAASSTALSTWRIRAFTTWLRSRQDRKALVCNNFATFSWWSGSVPTVRYSSFLASKKIKKALPGS
jgi:hypothetical protein